MPIVLVRMQIVMGYHHLVLHRKPTRRRDYYSLVECLWLLASRAWVPDFSLVDFILLLLLYNQFHTASHKTSRLRIYGKNAKVCILNCDVVCAQWILLSPWTLRRYLALVTCMLAHHSENRTGTYTKVDLTRSPLFVCVCVCVCVCLGSTARRTFGPGGGCAQQKAPTAVFKS